MRTIVGVIALVFFTIGWPRNAPAANATVAAATNFAEVLERLVADFEAASGHTLTVVTGSTGKLYAQIRNGAPFDVFLAADQERPRLLVVANAAVAESRFTYAVGHLVLWSASDERIAAYGPAALRRQDFRHLAMANASLAPYGAAAREAMDALGVRAALESRLVVGENVGQAFAMVATGNAELGFVALAHVLSPRNRAGGSYWIVPRELYRPIRQDAVLLNRARGNAAANAFLDWLRTATASATIERFGYGIE